MRITEIETIDRLFLLGPPGIGKTEIIRQKAEEEAEKLGKRFIDLREARDEEIERIFRDPQGYFLYYRVVAPHVFPEDLGIPNKDKGYVEFMPPKILAVLSIPDIHGILFIDELTNVQRDDQISMFFSLIQEKEAAWMLKLSKNIKIIAAGNPAEWSEIAGGLPKPLRNRMTILSVDPPSIDDWIDYMNRKYEDKWERVTGTYLHYYPAEFIAPPKQDDGFSAFPTPRSWTNTALLLYQFRGASDELKTEICTGNLGAEVGTKLAALLKTKVDLEKVIGEIKSDPKKYSELNINVRILVLSSMAQQNIDFFDKIVDLLKYMLENHREDIMVLLKVMDRGNRITLLQKYLNMFMPFIKDISRFFI